MTPQHPTALSVSVAQAAALTSFSQYEIRKAINDQQLQASRLGRRLVILVADLEEWLRSLPKAGDAA